MSVMVDTAEFCILGDLMSVMVDIAEFSILGDLMSVKVDTAEFNILGFDLTGVTSMVNMEEF